MLNLFKSKFKSTRTYSWNEIKKVVTNAVALANISKHHTYIANFSPLELKIKFQYNANYSFDRFGKTFYSPDTIIGYLDVTDGKINGSSGLIKIKDTLVLNKHEIEKFNKQRNEIINNN